MAAALAESTDGLIVSFDSAFDDDSHQGDTAEEFATWWGEKQMRFYGTSQFMIARSQLVGESQGGIVIAPAADTSHTQPVHSDENGPTPHVSGKRPRQWLANVKLPKTPSSEHRVLAQYSERVLYVIWQEQHFGFYYRDRDRSKTVPRDTMMFAERAELDRCLRRKTKKPATIDEFIERFKDLILQFGAAEWLDLLGAEWEYVDFTSDIYSDSTAGQFHRGVMEDLDD